MIHDYVAWQNALLGGALVGISSSLMLLILGRITGVSGMISSLLSPTYDKSWLQRFLFITFMVLAPLCYGFFTVEIPAVNATSSLPILMLAGLLVGFGTRLGSGCTSGHAVCGMSRLSIRSIIATLTFIVSGVLTVTIIRLMSGS